MPKNISYIRISDQYRQDGATQKNSIIEYANKNNFIINVWVEEKVSGSKTKVADREVSRVISELNPGDKLICTEISRLGRDKPFSIISIINEITETYHAELHLSYTEQFITQDNVENAEILFTVVGSSYVARQEAIKRSERAKAACNRRNGSGLVNGRPKGLFIKSKLDEQEDFIVRAFNDSNVSKSQLARDLKVSRSTLIRWLNLSVRLRLLASKDLGIGPKASLTEIKKALNESE
ncbi:MAG: DNA invertase Pin-like site-specific DNA recombinase [Oleiphilaceae bacterium]|jgi:DNA invertase Pin-like site-specific DNA recombinase